MPVIDIKVPDIGEFKDVPVVEIQVKPGDAVKANDTLITLESDKAAMDVPSPADGKIAAILVKKGDKVSQGSVIIQLSSPADGAGPSVPANQNAPAPAPAPAQPTPAIQTQAEPVRRQAPAHPRSANHGSTLPMPDTFGGVLASPSVRMIARELGVDLSKVTGTGAKGRITKDDVRKQLGQSSQSSVPAAQRAAIPEIPAQDFSKFGAIEVKPLSRLKKISGPHLHRAWLNIPHVTNNDEADITDLDGYRRILDDAAKTKGYRVTMVSFLLKACVSALKAYPELNASLSPAQDALIFKHYYHLGVAVDTPDGLVVPVIKDVDRKGIIELSEELAAVSKRMRDGKIMPSDIQGGTFSISSLGGIGGTGFTPIINAPEVAILGVPRAETKPVWDGSAFRPRLMLPLCLSYDHRVIDGALAARFLRKLSDVLGDVRQLVL